MEAAQGEWVKGKKEDVGGNRVGAELMGEGGQSSCDLLCKTAGLNLKMGGKTKLGKEDGSFKRMVLNRSGVSRPGPSPMHPPC